MRDGGARRGRKALVPGEHLIEPLLQQHRDRLTQAVKQVGGRRVGKEAGRVGLEHFFPVPVGPRHLVGPGRGARLFGDGVEASPGGSMNPFWEPATVTSTFHSSCR